MAKTAVDESDTGIVSRLARVETRTSDISASLKGIEKTIVDHGKGIAVMAETLRWVAKTQAAQTWWVRALVIMCLSTFLAVIGTCIEVNSGSMFHAAPTATPVETVDK